MRFRRTIGTIFAATTLLLTGVIAAGPASAATTNITPNCGDTVTAAPGDTLVLIKNLLNCPADGLRVTGSGFTLNLQGHTIGCQLAANGRNATPGDNAALHLVLTTNVTVYNGIFQYCDAGVAVDGGSGNILTTLYVHDNINDALAAPCNLGDGIAIQNSNNNTVTNSRINHNGPFGGVSLIENSDGNQVKSNPSISDNNVVGVGGGCGNRNQDEGVRIEGPGANNNRVEANTVERSLLAGISLHGYVGCPGQPPVPNPTAPNTDNFIVNNFVRSTGGNAAGDGIAALEQGPFGEVVCAAFRNTITNNNSVANQGYGIFIPATSNNNTINYNNVTSNGIDGIYLGGPLFHNVFTDIGPTDLTVVQPPGQTPFVMGTDYRALSGSGSGNVTARLVPIGAIHIPPPGFDTSPSGCALADFAASGFQAGDVALIQRGLCDRTQKVANAVAAGASAVVFFNEGSAGRTGLLTAGVNPVSIPVVGTTYAVGATLYNLAQAGTVIVHVETHTTNVNTQFNTGAENNTLTANRGTGNGEHDGHDDNPNCDNNRWTANKFATVNQACVIAGAGTGVVTPPM